MKALWLVLGLASACGGTTGSALITFDATASGASAATGGTLSFVTGQGASVSLTRARLHIGAVYLNELVPISGASSTSCISPGIYVGQALGPVELDLLSEAPVAFPSPGEGTQTEARTAEVWLSGGDINAEADPTVILDVAGTGVQQGVTYPFTATVTIAANRKLPVSNPALPGSNPICRQRIVTPISVNFMPTQGGTLVLRVDPRGMFNGLDFATLTQVSSAPPAYVVPDDNSPAGAALFKGLVASFGVYEFSWMEGAP